MNVEKTYPLCIAAKAAQLKNREFRRQVENNFIPLQGCDRPSTGTGVPTGYSRRRIAQAAITKSMTLEGVSISTAASAALSFTDEGQTGRAPGELFPCGQTLLTLDAGVASVRNVFHDTPIMDVTKHGACTIIVDLNRVVEKVDTVLDSQKAN
jgi:hypothetical protein